MAKKKTGPSKSDHIRKLLKSNMDMDAKTVIETLAREGIEVKAGLVYLVKGEIKGRKKRKAKREKMVAKVTSATGTAHHGDAVSLILQVKALASQVGGMGKLKALVEALS
jgi:hypothetical protein